MNSIDFLSNLYRRSIEILSKINLDSGSAIIEGSPDKDTVKSSIESAGYSVISISEDNNLKKTTATPSNSQKSDLYKLAPLLSHFPLYL